VKQLLTPSSFAACACVLSALVLSACGGGNAFSPVYPDNQEASVQTVLQRLSNHSSDETDPVAAGITTSPHHLFVVDLRTGEKRWDIETGQPASAPVIAGDYVLLHQTRGVVGYALRDGRELFVVEDEAMYLTGGGGEGPDAAFALSTGGGVGARSKLVIVRGGSVSIERDFDQTLGAPTLAAGMIFVPWATQNLSILDASTGDEIARVRITDSPIGRAYHQDGDLYFGQRGVFRLTSSIVSGTTDASAFVEAEERSFPGEPSFMADPYSPAAGPASAIHKIRLDWLANGSGETVGFADERLYLSFYRFVFGLAPSDAEGVHFVYEHSEDIVGAHVVRGGILIADQGGGFALINARGQQSWSAHVDRTPTSVTIRPGSFVPPATPSSEPGTIAEQLSAAAQSTDSRLVPARRFALGLMSGVEGEEVTAQLLAVCDNRQTPPAVKSDACTRLSTRTSGQGAVLRALERHASFLDDQVAPPVVELAGAASAMQARAAAPLIWNHIQDPQTPEAALPALFEALKELGAESSLPNIKLWLRTYHADARTDAMLQSLALATSIVLESEREDAVEFIATLAEDSLAPAAARGQMNEVLENWRAAQEAAESAEEEEEEGSDDGPTSGDGETEADTGPPTATTMASAMEVLAPVAVQIQACISSDERHAQSARVAIGLEGDGSIRSLSVLPNRLETCIGTLIRSQPFPGNTRGAREQITLTFRR
jgi:outer membrane protein assembly factor BamB